MGASTTFAPPGPPPGLTTAGIITPKKNKKDDYRRICTKTAHSLRLQTVLRRRFKEFSGVLLFRRWISRESWGKGGASWGKRRGFKEFYWSRRWISRERWGKGGASWGKGGGGPPRKPFANAMNRELSQKSAKGGKDIRPFRPFRPGFCLFPRVRRFFSPDSHPLSGRRGGRRGGRRRERWCAGEKGGAPFPENHWGAGFFTQKIGFLRGENRVFA